MMINSGFYTYRGSPCEGRYGLEIIRTGCTNKLEIIHFAKELTDKSFSICLRAKKLAIGHFSQGNLIKIDLNPELGKKENYIERELSYKIFINKFELFLIQERGNVHPRWNALGKKLENQLKKLLKQKQSEKVETKKRDQEDWEELSNLIQDKRWSWYIGKGVL